RGDDHWIGGWYISARGRNRAIATRSLSASGLGQSTRIRTWARSGGTFGTMIALATDVPGTAFTPPLAFHFPAWMVNSQSPGWTTPKWARPVASARRRMVWPGAEPPKPCWSVTSNPTAGGPSGFSTINLKVTGIHSADLPGWAGFAIACNCLSISWLVDWVW